MEALILNANPGNIKQLSGTEKLPGLSTKGPCRAGLEGRIALVRCADHAATLPSPVFRKKNAIIIIVNCHDCNILGSYPFEH